MPYQDGTGPMGTGPVGNRLGPCSNKGRYRYSNRYYWRGHSRHYGRFRGYYGPNYPDPYDSIIEIDSNPEEEKKLINKELTYLEKHKEALNKRLHDLNSKK